MNKSRKRIMALILSILLSFCVITPVLAEEGGKEDKKLYLLAAQKAECSIYVNKEGLASRAYFKGDGSVNKVVMQLSLQKYSKGTWQTVKSWSGATTKKVLIMTRNKSVGAGKYRAKTVFKVTRKSKMEAFVKYSSTINK